VPVCHNKRIKRNKVFKGYAEGQGHDGMVLRLQASPLCNERGEILNYILTRGNVDDRDEKVFNRLSDNIIGKLYANKGHISQSLFDKFFSNEIHIVTGLMANMKIKLMPLYDKIMLRKRSVIKTINDELKNAAQLVHSRHRSLNNFLINVLAVNAAYTFFDKKPSMNIGYEIEAFDGQLTLFN